MTRFNANMVSSGAESKLFPAVCSEAHPLVFWFRVFGTPIAILIILKAPEFISDVPRLAWLVLGFSMILVSEMNVLSRFIRGDPDASGTWRAKRLLAALSLKILAEHLLEAEDRKRTIFQLREKAAMMSFGTAIILAVLINLTGNGWLAYVAVASVLAFRKLQLWHLGTVYQALEGRFHLVAYLLTEPWYSARPHVESWIQRISEEFRFLAFSKVQKLALPGEDLLSIKDELVMSQLFAMRQPAPVGG